MKPLNCKASQRGAALVVSLILLLVVTLIGISGMQSTVLQEKMSGNFKDKNSAFQAAEAALREGEAQAETLSGHTGMTATCTNGLCYNSAGGTPLVTLETYLKSGNGIEADEVISGLKPVYLIDGVKSRPPGSTGWRYMYRIIAASQGQTGSSISELRSTYFPVN